MQIIELEIGQIVALAPGIRLTVLNILKDGVQLQIAAPAHVLITIGSQPYISLVMSEDTSSNGKGT